MLAEQLRTGWLGRTHEHHASIDSTNDRAAAWAQAGAPHGALVTADAQRQGRGRFARVWHSPPGVNLHASFVLRPGRADARWSALGLAVGVGLREGLLGWRDDVALSWPNDLRIGARKLGGILCEARWLGSTPTFVVGFGINVHPRPWPDELAAVAVSLGEANGDHGPARNELLARLLGALEPVLDAFAREGFAAVRERYQAACISLGQQVAVSEPGGATRRRVLAVGIDGDGALLVRAHPGAALERIDAGVVEAHEPQ
jgi:BirA family transcriptional regulator, biotin operon repressor / biotin---[acetyl-CoA-carboxylase] ligase